MPAHASVRQALGLGTALAAVACVSCAGGQKVYPVRGQVLFQGKPAAGATVVFHPVSADPKAVERPPTPTGTVQPDGSFTLSTYPYGDGAPPGEYKVAVVWLDREKAVEGSVPNRLPAKYASPQDSGLTATVNAGPTELQPFQLKK